MQACTLYSAWMPELLQQAVHIQQLLHVSPRDLECLFNRIKVEQQLHLTMLLLTAVDCRQRLELKSVANIKATREIAMRQRRTRPGHLLQYGDDRKKDFINLAGGGGGSKFSECTVCSQRVRLMKRCNTFRRPNKVFICAIDTSSCEVVMLQKNSDNPTVLLNRRAEQIKRRKLN